MVTPGTPLPEKLKHDAIIEALLEIRFDTPTLPEVFYGRLIDHPHWKGQPPVRLPAYDFPPQAREFEPVRYAPVLQLLGPPSNAALRFGPSILSYHRQAPYVGWNDFRTQLQRAIDSLFETTENNLTVTRLGFRYLNALTPGLHGINGITDLDLQVSVAAETITNNFNLNFSRQITAAMSSMVRVSTKTFLQGIFPADISVFVDVDIFTPDGITFANRNEVTQWVIDAHEQEKKDFFRLFRPPTIDSWLAK